MPGDPSPKGSSGGVIAYNHDSARGWNDPPTFAFSNNKTGNKPKLDLRKRVSHQQALHGVQTPSPSVQTTNAGNRDDIVNGVAGLSLDGVRQPVYTPPPVTTASLGNNILIPHVPTTFTRSISTPSFTSETATNSAATSAHSGQSTTSETVHAKSTENLSGNLGHPLFHLKDHSFEPVTTAHLQSIRSTAEIGDHLDYHHDSHTSRSPQLFHPIASPITTSPSVSSYQATPPAVPLLGHDNHASPQIFHPVTQPVTTAPSAPSYQATPPAVSPLGHVTPPRPLPYQSPLGHVTPPLYPVRGQSPIPPTIPVQGGGVANQLPPHRMTPPPPPGNHVSTGGSLSAGNTPRSTSPSGQEKNGDSASVSTVDDREGLKITMDALQDVMNKLHATLEKRVADDISRRLQVMSQSWSNGKLSQGVKSRMIKLAKALDDGNVEEAHHIHVSLMVDFVAEVNQWMVAVKKLINLVHSSNAFPTRS